MTTNLYIDRAARRAAASEAIAATHREESERAKAILRTAAIARDTAAQELEAAAAAEDVAVLDAFHADADAALLEPLRALCEEPTRALAAKLLDVVKTYDARGLLELDRQLGMRRVSYAICNLRLEKCPAAVVDFAEPGTWLAGFGGSFPDCEGNLRKAVDRNNAADVLEAFLALERQANHCSGGGQNATPEALERFHAMTGPNSEARLAELAERARLAARQVASEACRKALMRQGDIERSAIHETIVGAASSVAERVRAYL